MSNLPSYMGDYPFSCNRINQTKIIDGEHCVIKNVFGRGEENICGYFAVRIENIDAYKVKSLIMLKFERSFPLITYAQIDHMNEYLILGFDTSQTPAFHRIKDMNEIMTITKEFKSELFPNDK